MAIQNISIITEAKFQVNINEYNNNSAAIKLSKEYDKSSTCILFICKRKKANIKIITPMMPITS